MITFANYKKYSRIVRYILIGGITTVISFSTYLLFSEVFAIEENIANVMSITIAIIFAYISNKLFVFQSKTKSINMLISEFVKFIGSRVFTMVLEIILFYISITWLGFNDVASKMVITIFVIILNFALSRFFVFSHN